MATRRLYWDDPLHLSFEGTVVAQDADKRAIALDQTAFCPEAGGQPPDRGRLEWDGGSARVGDVQEAQDAVFHVLDAPAASLPAVGARVRGTVDEPRRRDHMSQHTGQHLLSRALLDLAKAPTVAIRLGESICTVDLSVAKLADEALADAEALVAKVVLEDRPVRILRPTPEELAKLPLRRELKVASDVRVIEIDRFDYSPCGGTHCRSTGQVGPVKVLGVERYKGGLRVSFNAGLRAFTGWVQERKVLSALAREFSSDVEGLPVAVQKLRGEAQQEARAASALRQRLAAYVAAEMLAKAPRDGGGQAWATAQVADEPLEFLRALAAKLAEGGAIAVLGASAPDGVRVVVERPAAAKGFEAGAALKRLAAACGGRGGGRPERAEGMLPTGTDLGALAKRELGAP